MFDMSDVTFIIPVRINLPERLNNLSIVIDHIKSNFSTNILVGESDVKTKLSQFENIKFYEDISEKPFNKSMLINNLVKCSKTPIIIMNDLDIIIQTKQYIEAVEMVRKSEADFVYPFDGNFYNVENYKKEDEKRTLLSNVSVGGSFVADKKSFISCGMMHEGFYGWGLEDTEFEYRIKKLEYKVIRTNGSVIHINHFRNNYNTEIKNIDYLKNNAILRTIKARTKQELIEEINVWSWIK